MDYPAHSDDYGDLAQAVEARLRSRIVSGDFALGDRLPTEREFSAEFRCSRGVIRKALDRLQIAGYIARRAGSGTYVTFDPGSEINVIDKVTPRELTECRLALEPYAVRIAVQNATRSDIVRLEGIAHRIATERLSNDEFTSLDKQFHMEIMKITRNTLFETIYKQINLIRERQEWQEVKDRLLNEKTIAAYNRGHIEIVAAFRSRDQDAACRAMREHLTLIRNDLGH